MNNLRLLAMSTAVALLSGGVGSYAQRVVTLEEIYQSAEASSKQLRPSITSVQEAESEISVARAQRLPDINASLSLSYIGDGFTTKRNLTDYQKAPIPHLGTGISLGVSQPVYMGGAITKSIEMAELKLISAGITSELTEENIRFQLTGFYLDIFKCRNLRRVVESNISSAEKVLADMEVRYEQGTVLRNDITRYELLLSNLRLQLIKIDNTLEILNNNLVTIAGLQEGTVIIPDSTILARSLPQHDEGWWQQEAKSNSSTLKLASNGVEMCKKGEELVKTERLPKIGLQASWTLDGPILVEVPPINRNLSYWYVGVGVNYNLSSLYKSNKALAKSKVATIKANEQLEVARENVSLAVRSDYVHYLESYEELKTQTKSVELAERNYQTVSTRYAEGMALVTDLLDAADARLNSQQQLVNAKINIIYYYHKLLFTSGTI